jgi:hypothetical protein
MIFAKKQTATKACNIAILASDPEIRIRISRGHGGELLFQIWFWGGFGRCLLLAAARVCRKRVAAGNQWLALSYIESRCAPRNEAIRPHQRMEGRSKSQEAETLNGLKRQARACAGGDVKTLVSIGREKNHDTGPMRSTQRSDPPLFNGPSRFLGAAPPPTC